MAWTMLIQSNQVKQIVIISFISFLMPEYIPGFCRAGTDRMYVDLVPYRLYRINVCTVPRISI
jgi:hypothetical protein